MRSPSRNDSDSSSRSRLAMQPCTSPMAYVATPSCTVSLARHRDRPDHFRMRTIRKLLCAALISASIGACYGGAYYDGGGYYGGGEYYANAAPPMAVDVAYAERPGYVWIQGHWGWNSGRWMWVGGYYEPERVGSVWIDGYWGYNGGRWAWNNGRWEAGRPGYSYSRGYYNNGAWVQGGWREGGNGGYYRGGGTVDHRGYGGGYGATPYRAPAGGGYRPSSGGYHPAPEIGRASCRER